MTTTEQDAAITKLEPQVQSLAAQAASMVIAEEADYGRAGEFLVTLKGMQKEVAATFDPVVAAAHQAHKAATAARAKHLDPLDGAERVIKGRMSTFRQEQQRIAAQAEAERQKILREQEEKERLERAVKAEEAGLDDLADHILETPVALPAAVAPPPPPVAQTKGVAEVKVWKFEIVEPLAVSREFLAIDEAKIRQVVKSMGEGAAAVVGGIRVYSDVQIRAGAK